MPSRDNKKNSWPKKTAVLGLSLTLAMILSYVETLIPINFGIPGLKLGLCNLVVLFLLYREDAPSALLVSFTRILLSGLLFTGVFGFLYSLAGGMLSFLLMFLLKKTDRFSVVPISLLGGMAHNTGQLFVALLVISNLNLFYYLPVLLLSGAVTGLVVGLLAQAVLRRISR